MYLFKMKVLYAVIYFLLFSLPVAVTTSFTIDSLSMEEPWHEWVYSVSRLKPFTTEQTGWTAKILNAIPSFRQVLQLDSETTRLISTECASAITLYNQGINDAQLWAMTMFDSSAKFPESILGGAFVFLGNFDQCIGMTSEAYNAPYSAQATGVVMYIRPINPLKTLAIVFGLNACMPQSCNSTDIQQIYSDVIRRPLYNLGAIGIVYVDEYLIFNGEKPALDAAAIVMIVVYCLLGFIVLLATLYDVIGKRVKTLKGIWSDILLSFSLPRNIKTLMSMKKSPTSISCLHGLRVLSLFWIMLGHRYISTMNNLNINDGSGIYDSKLSSLVYNTYVGVDTFFFLSGFLMCYVFIHDMNKHKSFKPIQFYVYRYVRLTTTMALVVGFYACLLPYVGYGPIWDISTSGSHYVCKRDWYLNFLYLGNYIKNNPDNPLFLCVGQCWYLFVDMQLAWLSPLVLLPLWKWPKKTCQFLLPILILASCFAPFTSTYINEFPMMTDYSLDREKATRFGVEIYNATHMRATPYLIGIAAAYFMIKTKNIDIKLPWWAVLTGWCISTGTCFAVLYAGSIQNDPNYVYDKVAAAFYAGFHRLGWSISLSWIVFACVRGYAGAVDSILSWEGWQPISKLSYSAYLTHLALILYQTGQIRTNSYFTNFLAIQQFLSDIMMTILGIATVLYLFCEAPTINLLRVLFTTKGAVKKEDVPPKLETTSN